MFSSLSGVWRHLESTVSRSGRENESSDSNQTDDGERNSNCGRRRRRRTEFDDGEDHADEEPPRRRPRLESNNTDTPAPSTTDRSSITGILRRQEQIQEQFQLQRQTMAELREQLQRMEAMRAEAEHVRTEQAQRLAALRGDTSTASVSSGADTNKANNEEVDWSEIITDNLKERCREMFDWSAQLTDRVARGYRQFLQIKVETNDSHAEQLSPSVLVDKMWHMHILDTIHYAGACAKLLGRRNRDTEEHANDGKEIRMIHHDPNGSRDAVARRARVRTTRYRLRALGEPIDREVWDFGRPNNHVADPQHEERSENETHTQSDAHSNSTQRQSSSPPQPEQELNGENDIENDESEPVAPQQDTANDATGGNSTEGEQRNLVASDGADAAPTGNEAPTHLQRQQQEQRRPRRSVLIVRVALSDPLGPDAMIYFKLLSTTRFRRVFTAFAERISVNLNELRFLYGGDRVLARDTPVSLGMVPLNSTSEPETGIPETPPVDVVAIHVLPC